MSKDNVYSPSKFEQDLYESWKQQKLFNPVAKNKNGQNFSIILPPPNVTGQLHLGHA
jgi:valyl-tRNA synthetase